MAKRARDVDPAAGAVAEAGPDTESGPALPDEEPNPVAEFLAEMDALRVATADLHARAEVFELQSMKCGDQTIHVKFATISRALADFRNGLNVAFA